MKRSNVSLVFGLFASVAAPGSGQAAFESLPLAPEAAAIGGALATSRDPVFGNPAGASPGSVSAGWRTDLSVGRPFGLAELSESQASVHRRRGGIGGGLGFRRFGTAAYAEHEIRAVVSWRPARAARLGLAIRGLSAAGSHLPAVRSVALDMGVLFLADADTQIGAVVDGILGEVPGDPRGELRRTSFGARHRVARRWTAHVELQRREDRPLSGILGITWQPSPSFALRAGAREDPLSLAWGFAIGVRRVMIAGSWSRSGALGATAKFGVVLGKNGGDPTESEEPI